MIFNYDSINSISYVTSYGNGAFAYMNLPLMMIALRGFSLTTISANYLDTLHTSGSFLYIESLAKLTIEGMYGDSINIWKS